MKKFLILSILSLTCLTSFAAKFEMSKANALVRAKDWTGLQNYMKTNTELQHQNHKKVFVNLNLIVRGKTAKDITKENLIQEIQKVAKENNLAKEDQLYLLYNSRHFTKDLTIEESAKLTLDYFAENNFKIQDLNHGNLSSIFYSYIILKDFKNAIIAYKEIITQSKNEFSIAFATSYFNGILNYFSFEEKLEYAKMLNENPELYIKSAKDLEQVIDMLAQITDQKYDELVKSLYIKLNRIFYKNISKSDDWKLPLVKLQLQMKAYNI